MQFWQVADEILQELSWLESIVTKEQFQKKANHFYKKYGYSKPLPNILLYDRYRMLVKSGVLQEDIRMRRILRKRDVRSTSGVAVVSVLTKPYPCPGTCIYCPNVVDLPKSYIAGEPAVMRAQLNNFDAFFQVLNRLYSLYITGHEVSKCDVRVIGGSWSAYPLEYQETFIKDLYDAHTLFKDVLELLSDSSLDPDQDFFALPKISIENMRRSKTLEEAQERNTDATSRVIGIAIETRPDKIDTDEIVRLRRYGVTRVEIGYQTTFEEIHKLNKRGHGNKESIKATQLLKDAGIKVVAHMMPNLYGSNPKMDVDSFTRLFSSEEYQPDEIKIYPLVVTANTEIEQLYQKGEFVPYDNKTLIEVVASLYHLIPEYVRLNRLYRDIPATEIIAGCKLANLRQHVLQHMHKQYWKAQDISAREIRGGDNNPENAILDVVSYKASEGTEYFLQYVDPVDQTLFSLLRLRIPKMDNEIAKKMPELQGAAIIREVHSFGDHLALGVAGVGGQHFWFGKKLLAAAESLVLKNHGEYNKIAIISGVGVRRYYEKTGYNLEGSYMIKQI